MKTNYRRILTLTAIAFLVTGLPALASKIDAGIESSARNSFVFRTYLKGDKVKVKSREGIVTLSGTVNQESHKALAEKTVENLPGVKSVDNRLELKGDRPAKNSNEWIALKVKTALLFHRSVSATNTRVYVEEGIVTLRGEAANEAQRELTTEYADVEGVREVRNEMTVANAPENAKQSMKEKIDDASITAQVKLALLIHRSTSAVKTSVATREGIVTLSGRAQNAAEKDLVTKLTSDIIGVRSTVNNMRVK